MDVGTLVRALEFARDAHRGQVDPVMGAPYTDYLVRVAARVLQRRDAFESEVVAALLHSVVGRTDVPHIVIVDTFGAEVAAVVAAATLSPQAGTSPAADTVELERLRTAPLAAQRVVVYGLLDRLESLYRRGAEVCRRPAAQGYARFAQAVAQACPRVDEATDQCLDMARLVLDDGA